MARLAVHTEVVNRKQEMTMNGSQAVGGFVLCFCRLQDGNQLYAFPCDACGNVDMDSLSERARHNYLYARALMGLQVGWPAVQSIS